MAAIVGSLRADLEANVGTFKSDMGAAAASVDGFNRKSKQTVSAANAQQKAFGGLGGTLQSLAKIGAGLAAVDFLRGAVTGAIEAEETAAALERQFGALGSSVEGWAEDTADALGRVDDDLKNSALAFGTLFQKVVPTQGAAADMSETMTKLAVDLATLNRVPIAEATEKLKAGLGGATKGLKEYGILITKAEVDQKAVAMGLAATTKQVSSQDRALATYNLILEKTANIQGYAATQVNTTAGKMRAFQAQVDSLADDLGAILLPVLTEVVKWFGLYADGIRTILGDTDDFQRGLVQLGAQMSGKDVGEAVRAFNATRDAIDETGRAAATNGGIIEDEFEGIAQTPEELAKSMRDARHDVNDLGRAVRDFGVSDVSKFSEANTDLGDQFASITDRIEAQILAFQKASKEGGNYSEHIAVLNDLMGRLRNKYLQASEAAIKLAVAQQDAGRARLEADLGAGDRDIASLARARGDMGVQTENQQRAIDLEEQLQAERERGAALITEMEVARQQALIANDIELALDLATRIDQQAVYQEMLAQTSAAQIQNQEDLQALVIESHSATASSFGDLLKGIRDQGGDFDTEAWGQMFWQRLTDGILERDATNFTDKIFEMLGIGTGEKNQDVDTINAKTINVAGGMGDGAGGIGKALGAFGQAAGGGGGEGGQSNVWSALGGWAVKNFAGFFAEGGTIPKGQWGVLGERGPEPVFAGNSDLDVMPNGGGPGGVTMNVYTPNADSFRRSERDIARGMNRRLQPNG